VPASPSSAPVSASAASVARPSRAWRASRKRRAASRPAALIFAALIEGVALFGAVIAFQIQGKL
jgi:F0F1-type ATP synthase membrane subunit c/vacuolar-type H+-ATPase subunit K